MCTHTKTHITLVHTRSHSTASPDVSLGQWTNPDDNVIVTPRLPDVVLVTSE